MRHQQDSDNGTNILNAYREMYLGVKVNFWSIRNWIMYDLPRSGEACGAADPCIHCVSENRDLGVTLQISPPRNGQAEEAKTGRHALPESRKHLCLREEAVC